MEDLHQDGYKSPEETEEDIGDLVCALNELIMKDEGRTSVLDLTRMDQIMFCYTALKFYTKNMKVKLSYKLNEPYQSMGSISVEGKCMEFKDPRWFSRIAEFASSMEVYPLAERAVRITFTFHGMTNPIE